MEFMDELQICLDELSTGRMTIDGCLQRRPDAADQLRPLLATALLLRQAAQASMDRAARAEREKQFLARARTLAVNRRRNRAVQLLRYAVLMAFTLVVVLGGVDYAAASSLPGDHLYEFKRIGETVRLSLTPAEQRPWLQLEYAQRRLTEFEQLAARGQVDGQLLTTLETNTESIAEEIPVAEPQLQSALRTSLVSHIQYQQTVLSTLLPQFPETDQAQMKQVLQRLAGVQVRVSGQKRGPLPESTPLASPTAINPDHSNPGSSIHAGSSVHTSAWSLANRLDRSGSSAGSPTSSVVNRPGLVGNPGKPGSLSSKGQNTAGKTALPSAPRKLGQQGKRAVVANNRQAAAAQNRDHPSSPARRVAPPRLSSSQVQLANRARQSLREKHQKR